MTTHTTVRKVLFAAATWLVLSGTIATASVTDNAVHVPANYYGFLPPAKGGTYVDSVFGTTIKRVSNAPATVDEANGGYLQYILNEYATPSLWNSTNTYFLLQHGSYFGLYDGSGNFVKTPPLDMHAATEPRWSRTDPNVVYYKRGNSVKSYNVSTNAIAVVHTFGEYGAISGRGKADIGFGGNKMVLSGDTTSIFVYDADTNTKGPVFNTGGNGYESLHILANDQVMIGWNATGSGRYRGLELFDANMTFVRQLAQATGHMDVTRDVNGDPIVVYTSSADPAAVCENGITKIRVADGQHTCLLSLNWNLAVHISANDQGWAVVSVYTPSDPDPSGFWPAYTNEVFRVRTDGSVIERLAHHRSRPFNSYNYMAKASISRDGTRITYSSNYGQGGASDYGDVYLMNLGGGSGTPAPTPRPTAAPTSTPAPSATPSPTATPAPTSGPTPTPAPTGTPTATTKIEQNHSSVTYTGTWTTQTKSVHSGGSSTYTQNPGAKATVAFTGTAITWRGSRDPWAGKAEVYVDGTLRATVDTYSAVERNQDVLYTASGLTSGAHTFRVKVLGTKNPAASGALVWVDSFEITGGGAATPTSTPVPTATPRPTAAPTSTPVPTATPPTAPTATPPAPTTLEQNHSSVSYTGTWTTQTKSVHSGGSAAYSGNAGAEATVSFTGTAITWRGSRDPWAGQAEVYVDGTLKATVDTYSATERNQDVLYTAAGLVSGTHTFKVKVLGTMNPAAGGALVWADSFEITGGGGAPAPTPTPTPTPAAPVRVEESNPAVQYSGTWFPNSASVHSGGAARGAMDAGAQVTFTFTGTGVRWIGYRDEWSGNARVLVDGQLRAVVDTYSSPQSAQQVLQSVTGLAVGAHTLTIDVPGTHGPSSGGSWVWVDAFEVVP